MPPSAPLYGLITNIGFYRGSDHLADGSLAMAFLDRLVEGPIIIKMITVCPNTGTTGAGEPSHFSSGFLPEGRSSQSPQVGAADQSTEAMLRNLRATFATASTKWSLTGGPAAFELQHFYKGIEIPVFVESLSDEAIRKLRLLPDRTGPLIFLKSFGTVPYWKKLAGKTIAHPWLIYSELMYSSDPRAHEAAEQLKAEFLKP